MSQFSLLCLGGKYLTVMEPKATSGKVARLVLPIGHLSHSGDLCLSFRHLVSGENSGKLQVYVRRSGVHGPAVWGRNGGGHGWGETHITLPGAGVRSVSRSITSYYCYFCLYVCSPHIIARS